MVIIPTRDRWPIASRTLDALTRQSVTGFEVVVVVDGLDQSGDRDARFRWMQQEHAGPGAARNTGVKATSQSLVLFLGDDMIPSSELVERHLEVHNDQLDVQVGVLGHIDWHPEVAMHPLLRWMDWSTTQFDYAQIRNQAGQDVGFSRFYSSNVSLKRDLIDRAGGFDEDFIYYYEDLDLGWRLGEAGLRLIYEPRALAEHLHEYDLERLRRRFEGIALGERLMADKHGWFEPYFHERVSAASSAAPASERATKMVDWIRWPAGLAKKVRGEANRWYLQQVAPGFLRSWDRAAEITELRAYLGDAFEPRKLLNHVAAVEDEARHAPDELAFYRTSTSYLYDLAMFATWPTKDPYVADLKQIVPEGSRLLDYGCGIGSDGLRLIADGYEVAFADFANPSVEYLRWRLERRQSRASVYDIEADDIPGGHDAVYAFDVIEHVPDPFAFLERLERLGRIVIVNLLEHDDDDVELHHDLPMGELLAFINRRTVLLNTNYYGRSNLIVYSPPESH